MRKNNSKKKIALFDIDNTVYNGYIFLPLVKFQLRKKIINQDCLSKLYKDFKLYKTGKVNYEATIANLLFHWVKGLKGTSYRIVSEETKRFFENEKNKFFPYFKPIIAMLRKTHDVYFVTGEPQFVGQILSELFKITGFISSEFEIRKGIFTGKVKKLLARRKEKLIAIRQLLTEHDRKDSLAFGDSEGDIEILGSIENAICINPTKGLRKIAQERGWSIVKPNEVKRIVRQKLVDNNS